MTEINVTKDPSNGNVALAERAWLWLDAERDWTTGSTRDLQQQYFDLLADDVVLEVDAPGDTFGYGSTFRGKRAVIEMYENAPQWFSDNRLERPLEFVGSGDRVVVLGAERYTIKKSGVTARKKEFAIVMDFRDGRIVRLRQLGDMFEWIDAYRRENIAPAKKTSAALEGNRGGTRVNQSQLFAAGDPSAEELARRCDESVMRSFERDGYCVIEGVLSERQLAALRARLDEQMAGEQALCLPEVQGKIDQLVPDFIRHGTIVDADHANFNIGSRQDQRVCNLINKGAIFRELVVHPMVKAIMSRAVGTPYLLSNCTANITRTPKSAQVIHSDQHYIPSPQPEYCLGLNLFWLLDDYTPDNGATRVVPGSHRRAEKKLLPTDFPEAHPVLAPAGSILFYDARLLHGAGPNTSGRPRRSIVTFYTRFFLRQIENFYLQTSPEVLAQADAELRELLGFRVHSILGAVDGHYGVAATNAKTVGDAEAGGIGGYFVDRPSSFTGPLAADGSRLSPTS